MKIPVITDEMLDRVLAAAASPVCVIFVNTENGYSLGFAKELWDIVKDFEQTIIFLTVDLAENPSAISDFISSRSAPTIVFYHLNRHVRTYVDVVNPCQFLGALEHFTREHA